MARITLQGFALTQATVTTSAATVASLLSLTTDDECLAEEIVLQADTGNSVEIFIGGVDGAGAADVSITKCIKLPAGNSLTFSGDDTLADEDRVVIDLRQISVRSGSAGQKLNVMTVKKTAVAYNS